MKPIMKYLSWQVFHYRSLLLRSFWSFVLPVLEYCSAVWCSAADSQPKLLDRVIRSAGFLAGGVLDCNFGLIECSHSLPALHCGLQFIIIKVRFFILFHSCCSHARVFWKTFVHEFNISYSTGRYLLFSDSAITSAQCAIVAKN